MAKDRSAKPNPLNVAGQENFTINEFAAWSRLSRATVYRLIKAGSLKTTKIGGRTIIRRSDAEALMRN